MIYAEKHLSLLSRMERDGLQLRFTGEFPEEILDQTCKKIEDMGLQEKLRKEEATQIQRELIQVPEFAELYQALCAQGVEVSVIHTMLQSARSYQEHLSQYPKEQVLGAAALDLKPSLKFEYMTSRWCGMKKRNGPLQTTWIPSLFWSGRKSLR